MFEPLNNLPGPGDRAMRSSEQLHAVAVRLMHDGFSNYEIRNDTVSTTHSARTTLTAHNLSEPLAVLSEMTLDFALVISEVRRQCGETLRTWGSRSALHMMILMDMEVGKFLPSRTTIEELSRIFPDASNGQFFDHEWLERLNIHPQPKVATTVVEHYDAALEELLRSLPSRESTISSTTMVQLKSLIENYGYPFGAVHRAVGPAWCISAINDLEGLVRDAASGAGAAAEHSLIALGIRAIDGDARQKERVFPNSRSLESFYARCRIAGTQQARIDQRHMEAALEFAKMGVDLLLSE